MKPSNESQFSASYLILSRHLSSYSFPIELYPLAKLLAASSLPEMSWFKWKSSLYFPTLIWSITVGSRSNYIARGTSLFLLVSEKKVENELSQRVSDSLGLIFPSGSIPCSMQKSSQQAFPTCTPAYPIWMEMTSFIQRKSLWIRLVLWCVIIL